MPMGRGLVVHTLHEAKDIHDPSALFDSIPAIKPDSDMVALAVQLIDRQTAKFDLSDMADRYEARLREVIEAKLKGKGIKAVAEPKSDGKVVDLMAALKRSLGQAPDKPAAKAKPSAAAAPKRPARKRA
jgi:DNA end-binding protein Ku